MRMMGSLTCVLIALVALSSRAVWATSDYQEEEYSNHYSECWDCNYAPSGFLKSYSDWQHGTTEVGYLRCALVTRYDPFFIHKNPCKSGRCYIRKEENGMVYRGCADDENLPWNVRTNVNCEYQGHDKALWWFCDGDKCNRGQLGETEDTCGSPPASPTYAPKPTEPSTQGYNTTTTDKGSQYGHNQYEHHQYGTHVAAVSLVRQGHPADPTYRQDHREQEDDRYGYGGNEVDHYGGGYQHEATPPASEYNPCDGRCHKNPSGLFKDPARPDHFIQCGCDNHYGRPCTCCKPFYLRCDRYTEFDDTKKVCVRKHDSY